MKKGFLFIALALTLTSGFAQNGRTIRKGDEEVNDEYRGGISAKTVMLVPEDSLAHVLPGIPVERRIRFNPALQRYEGGIGTTWHPFGGESKLFGVTDSLATGDRLINMASHDFKITNANQIEFGKDGNTNAIPTSEFTFVGNAGTILPDWEGYIMLYAPGYTKYQDMEDLDVDVIQDGETNRLHFNLIEGDPDENDVVDYFYIYTGDPLDPTGMTIDAIFGEVPEETPNIKLHLRDLDYNSDYRGVYVDGDGNLIKTQQPSISAEWGSINGDINDQSDLTDYINSQVTGLHRYDSSFRLKSENPDEHLPLGIYAMDLTISEGGQIGASGNYSFAANGGSATGANSIAIGAGTVASGAQSMSIGMFNTASGVNSTIIGQANTATSYGQAYGYGNTVGNGIGIGSTNNIAGGSGSVAVGYTNNSSFDGALLFGSNLEASSFQETVIGRFSEDRTPGSTVWSPSDPAFRVGIGQSSAKADGFVIYKNGVATLPQSTISGIDGGSGKTLTTKEWVNSAIAASGGSDTAQDVFGRGPNVVLSEGSNSVSLQMDGSDGMFLQKVTTSGSYKGIEISNSAVTVYDSDGIGIRFRDDYSEAQIIDNYSVASTLAVKKLIATSDTRPYKVYTAFLQQTGTSAPVATVLENTLGVTITWSRSSTGIYGGSASAPVFTNNKTTINNPMSPNGAARIYWEIDGTSAIHIGTEQSNVSTDGLLFSTDGEPNPGNCWIEIRVYN
ncbi:hypothetical protein [Flavobacterium cerinum]|uniref:Uncharacterized protein n=1 Tax=Flavobacterium cerinum TaxID=2502784 RepID=A0A3S3U4X2_9FLAO|nr:hypothetical protein [Flavobacterium cerinum]RWX03350.1 hypothetical protein EPI11_00025 [Flavobacterium cerinum]